MTRSEFLKAIIENNLEKFDTELIDQALKDIFIFFHQILLEDERIEIRDFGIFNLTTRTSRSVRNPASGVILFVPSMKYACFRPSKLLKKILNNF